jgi:hypothetical protein
MRFISFLNREMQAPAVFKISTIDAHDALAHGCAIANLRNRLSDIIIVKNVFSPLECLLIQSRLSLNVAAMVKTDFPDIMKSYFLGVNLNLAEEELVSYFDEALRFNRQIEYLFHDLGGFDQRVFKLLSSLYGGKNFCSAPGPGSSLSHMLLTFRCHFEGGFIPVHFDSEQYSRHSYRYLSPQISGDLFSYVMVFSAPEGGGELEIFDYKRGKKLFRMSDGPDDAQNIDVANLESQAFALNPGSMLIFNSGQLLHRVNPVRGKRPRWTACSFMSEALDSNCVYAWG